MVEVEKQEEKCKEQQEDIRICWEIKEHEAAAAHEADRERERERGRGRELVGLRKLGRML
jgi:hypothetical protein